MTKIKKNENARYKKEMIELIFWEKRNVEVRNDDIKNETKFGLLLTIRKKNSKQKRKGTD